MDIDKDDHFKRSTATAHDEKDTESRQYVYLFMSAYLISLIAPLARRIKRENGWRTILVTNNLRDLPRPERFGWEAHDFEEILDLHDVLKAQLKPNLPNPKALSDACALLEQDLEISALDLIKCDRHVGLGFITSSWFHSSRYGKKTNYQQSLDIAVRLCRFFEDTYKNKPPALILAYPGGIATNAMVSVAEAQGVPMRWLMAPRWGNQFYWAENRHGWPVHYKKDLEANYQRILLTVTDAGLEGFEMDIPNPERFKIHRDYIQNQTGVLDLIRNCYNQIRHTLPQRLRRWEPRYGDYLTRDKVWFELLHWLHKRRMVGERELFSHLPQGVPFVFYPLSMEPEISLQVEAHFADFQLGHIDMLAKTVPAGWNVVIKEHPVHPIPRRRSFRDIVSRYPNVLQAGTLEGAEPFIERASVVATVNGTIGFQAAIRGKPVITFNKMYQIAEMPHVRIATSYDELRASFRDIQNSNLPPLKERRAAIEAHKVTMARHEFAISDKNMLSGFPTSTPLLNEEFEALFMHLLVGVESTATAKPASGADATFDRAE